MRGIFVIIHYVNVTIYIVRASAVLELFRQIWDIYGSDDIHASTSMSLCQCSLCLSYFIVLINSV